MSIYVSSSPLSGMISDIYTRYGWETWHVLASSDWPSAFCNNLKCSSARMRRVGGGGQVENLVSVYDEPIPIQCIYIYVYMVSGYA